MRDEMDFAVKIRRLLIISFMAFATIFTFSGCSKDAASLQNEVMSVFDDKYITQVKKGHLQMAPNITIGEAFADFFGEPKWESFESTDGQRVVEFTGRCTWQDKPAICKMQFIIKDGGTFETGAVKINDTNLNVLETALIMAKILGKDAVSDNDTSETKSTAETALTTNNAEPSAKNEVVSRPPSNAMLGNVKLGDSLALAEKTLGEPTKKTEKEAGKLRYVYPLMDVAYDFGEVTGMAADDASVTTPMGLHAGSSLQEVLNVYGAGYMLSTYGDLDLYEYKYKDENQRAYLLRFAVKQNSGVVNYISIRYVD